MGSRTTHFSIQIQRPDFRPPRPNKVPVCCVPAPTSPRAQHGCGPSAATGGGGLRVGSHLATAGGTWQRGRSGTASTECSHVRGHGAEPSRVPVRQRRHRGAGDGASRAFPCSEKRGPRVSPPAPGSEQHAWHGSGSGPGTDVARWGRRRGQRGDALRAPPPQPRCERSDRAPSKRCRANRAARRPPRARRPRVPPSPRGTHLAEGTADALSPARLPARPPELHPGLYTASVAAHPSQTGPLLRPSAAGVPRSPRRVRGHRTAPRPRPILSFPP